jgi:hypothetical protein
MNAVEENAKRWAKRENEELDSLSEWVKSVRGILNPESETLELKYVPHIRLYLVNQK